jgi:O-antigen ligase
MSAARLGAPSRGPGLVIPATVALGALLGVAVGTGQVGQHRFLLIMVVAAAVCAAWIAWQLEPAYVFSGAIALSLFSGNWGNMGLPGGATPDRFLLFIGLVALLLRQGGAVNRPPFKVEPAHWALVVVATYAVVSALVAGTLFGGDGFFRLLDRLGIVPFLMFFLAPVVFRTARERAVLLATLVAVGAYLGLTSLFETIHLKALVFPRYILDPSIGLHSDRARGPFLEAEANGMALYGAAVIAVIAAFRWRKPHPWAAAAAAAVALICAAGTLFSMQRAVWIGAVLATIIAPLVFYQVRRWVLPAVAVVPVIVIVSFALIPGLAAQAGARKDAERPVWDRKNLNAASLRMIEARPLFGFGWEKFRDKSSPYFQQAENYPLTAGRQSLHNAFLSNAVELGLVGTSLWIFALVMTVGAAILTRGPPELEPWRIGLVAYTVMWIVVANFTPLERPFTNILLMTWAGLVFAGRYAVRGVTASNT